MTLDILIGGVLFGTPLLIAALGELIAERSGVLNLGVEGMMLTGALGGIVVALTTGQTWVGFLAGGLLGGLIALAHVYWTHRRGADHVTTGLMWTLGGVGLTTYLGSSWQGVAHTGFARSVDHPIVMGAVVLAIGLWWFLTRTRSGRVLRAVGDAPETSHALGLSVMRVRWLAVWIGGLCAGFAGALLVLWDTASWQPNLTLGRGWIALALVPFAAWNPLRLVIGAYLFGGVFAMLPRLQLLSPNLPFQLMEALPYVVLIAGMVVLRVRDDAPRSLTRVIKLPSQVRHSRPPSPTAASEATSAIHARDLAKRYGSVSALDGVSLDVHQGTVHALLGENGAGKSTLVNVLGGRVVPDAGVVARAGQALSLGSPKASLAAGIGVIYQHGSLVPTLTVRQSIELGTHHPPDVDAIAREYGLDVPFDAVVETLSPGQRQRAEVLRALCHGAQVLVMDEPTQLAVSPDDADRLLRIARKLADAGLAVLFITHKVDEALRVADEATVLRGGKVTGRFAEVDTDDLREAMFGSLAAEQIHRPECEDAIVEPTLGIRRGEVVGVAGVEGNGQHRLALELAQLGPGRRAYIPEDRQSLGLLDGTVAENLLGHRPLFGRNGYDGRVRELIERYGIVASPQDDVRALSGGNVQKVMVARELSRTGDLIVAENPTRGLDERSRRLVHQELVRRADDGQAIVLISPELEELFQLCHRIVVMLDGEIVHETDPPFDSERIAQAMTSRSTDGVGRPRLGTT